VRKTKVLLVDKREIFREGLARLLSEKPDIEVLATCGCSSEAIEKAQIFHPDVVIIDTELEENGCAEATRCISEYLPSVKIIILTHSEEDSDLLSTFEAGAKGYVSKDLTIDDLIKTITLVLDGAVIISAPMAAKVLNEFSSMKVAQDKMPTNHGAKLSKREHEVLRLVAKGISNKDIAKELFITENTVKVHLHNIMEKLKAHNRLQAVMLARGWGVDVEGEGDRR